MSFALEISIVNNYMKLLLYTLHIYNGKVTKQKSGKLRRRRKVPLSVIFGTKLSKRKRLKKWKIVKQCQKTKRMREIKRGKTRRQRKTRRMRTESLITKM